MAVSKKKDRKKCGNKKAFDTLQEAKAAAAMLVKRKKKKGQPIVTILRAYGCHCGKFHFGRTKYINWDLIKPE